MTMGLSIYQIISIDRIDRGMDIAIERYDTVRCGVMEFGRTRSQWKNRRLETETYVMILRRW